MRLLAAWFVLACSAPALAGGLVVTVTAVGDKGARPVAAAAVALVPAGSGVDANEALSDGTRFTDAEGRVEVVALPGPSVVLVRADGFAIASARIREGETRATIVLPPAAALAGTVRDHEGKPVGGARVIAAAERTEAKREFLGPGEVGFEVTADDEGAFRILQLTAGLRYRLIARSPGRAPGRLRDAVAGAGPVTISLARGASVAGRLFRIPGGKPLEGAQILIGGVSATTGEGGDFTMAGVPAGQASVVVKAAGFLFSGPRELVLRDGEHRGGLFLKALALGGLKGRILTSSTRPVVGAKILLRYPRDTDIEDHLPPDRIVHAGESGEKGTFDLPGLLPSQGVDLIVRHPDHAPTVHLGYSIVAGMKFTAIVLMRDGGSISGRVINDSGEGIPGVTVHALDSREEPDRILGMEKPLFPTHRQGMTDESGGFTLTHVPAGRRTIVARKEGILPAVERGVEVGEGIRRKNVILLAGKGSRIAGVVTDPAGRPIPGALVFARAALGLRYERHAADNGTFEFPGLPAGKYAVHAAAEGYASSPAVAVTAPAVDVAVVLTAGTGLSGRVLLEESPEPVAPASVRVLRQVEASALKPWEPKYVTVRETRAEPPDARFAAGNLEPGIYRVEAWTEDGKFGFRDGVRIEKGRPPAPVVVRVMAGWAIRGRVVDGRNGLPLEGATVALRTGADQPGPHRASTDGLGHFRIDGVGAGFHSLLVVARGFAPQIVDSVEVKAASDAVLEDVVLLVGSKLSGTVTGPEGEARAGVRLTLESAILGGTREERTDEQGRFSFANVSPGSYLLIADDGLTGQFARRQERLVTVKEGKDLVISLGTGKGSILMGRITSAGAPVGHAEIAALLAAGEIERRRQVIRTKSDAEGNYVFTDIPTGDHLLTVTLPWSGKNPVRFGARVPPGPVTILDLILPDSGIEGRTFDIDSGLPLQGALLRLTRDTGGAEGTFLAALTREMGEIRSGKDGAFRFPALPPGEYRIDAYRDGYGQTNVVAIRVLPGGFTPVRMEMPPAGVLAGRVVDDRGRPVTTARVRFVDIDGEVATRRPWYPVDAEGHFRIGELRTGTYTVEAQAPGFARAEKFEAEVFPGGGVTITLRLKIEGRLEVTVYGEGGVLLAGARLSVIDFWGRPVEFPKPAVGPLTPYRDPAITGDGGRILLRNLPPGVYTVTAQFPGHAGPPLRVRVLDGELSRGALVLLPVR